MFVKGPEDYDGESEVEEVVVPKNTDTAFPNITQNDQSEKYAAAAASLLPQHQSVNDYGFIYDLEDDDAQDMSGSGSMVGEFSTSSMGHLESTSAPSSHLWGADFWAENDKRAAIRKQEAVRASELKWIQAIAQMPVDQVKKSNKVSLTFFLHKLQTLACIQPHLTRPTLLLLFTTIENLHSSKKWFERASPPLSEVGCGSSLPGPTRSANRASLPSS